MDTLEALPEPSRDILDTLARVAAAILVSELVAMTVVSVLGLGDGPVAWLVDAGVLAVVATPLILAAVWYRLPDQSRSRVILQVAAMLVAVEMLVMWLLSWLGLGSSPVIVGMLDASLVLFFSMPLVCLVLIRCPRRLNAAQASIPAG